MPGTSYFMLSSLSSRSFRFCVRPTYRRPPPGHGSIRLLTRLSKVPTESSAVVPEGIPSFKDELFKEYPRFRSFKDEVQRPRVLRQVLFVTLGSAGVFFFMAARCNEDTTRMSKLLRGVTTWTVSSEEMRRARTFQLAETFREHLKKIHAATSQASTVLSRFLQWGYAKYAQAVVDASESKRLAWQICAANFAVWVFWQSPSWKPAMTRYFLHNPLSGMSITLLTSMFSHQSFIHFLFNSLALSSFGAAAGTFLTGAQKNSEMQESSVTYQLLAFYISAGLFSGLTSHVASRVKFSRFINKLKSGSAAAGASPKEHGILPSLGASGAIYGCVSMCALAFPTAHIALAIPPSFPIPITWGVGGMVCLDILGILRGWRVFDHWAHLGGAAYGAMYYFIGPPLWDALRRDLAKEQVKKQVAL